MQVTQHGVVDPSAAVTVVTTVDGPTDAMVNDGNTTVIADGGAMAKAAKWIETHPVATAGAVVGAVLTLWVGNKLLNMRRDGGLRQELARNVKHATTTTTTRTEEHVAEPLASVGS